MRQLDLFDSPPASASPSPVHADEPSPQDVVPSRPVPDSRHRQSDAGGAATLPLRSAADESWVMYAPAGPGDDLAATLRRALAAFRERRGAPPSAVAAHPSGAAALASTTALPIYPLATCPRGQVWLQLP